MDITRSMRGLVMSKKRVLITGGAGFIGCHVVEMFLEKSSGEHLPHEVMIVDNLSGGSDENLKYLKKHWGVRIRFIKEDIRNFSRMANIFTAFNPEVVVHLAAQPSLKASRQDPINDASINIMGTLNMIQLSNEQNVHRFVFSSTSAAEESFGYYWVDEAKPPNSPYGISKRTAEYYLSKINTGGNVVILRLANVYGPRQVPLGENQLIPRALSHIYQKTDFVVYGDGKQTRDFIYVKDVAEAIYLASTERYDMGGLYNISTCKQTSVLDVLEIIRKETKHKRKWKIEGYPIRKAGRLFVDMPDNGFRYDFDWEPRVSLLEGIQNTAGAWLKE